MSNLSSTAKECYLYNEDDPEAWGDCCEDYGLVPKPIWVMFLLTVPIEFVVANSLTVSTGEVFEKKKGKEAWFFIGFNLLTLALILAEFDWSSCEGDGFRCYQGLLFLFYNSTAAITSLTLWVIVLLRKFFPHLLSLLLIAVGPIAWLFDTFCDDQDIFNTDTGLFSWNKEIVSKARDTKMFWYHYMALVIMLAFGGLTHFIPMTFGAYIYISVFLFLMMLVSHTYRLRSIDIWQKQKGPRDQKRHTRALIGALGVYAVSPLIVTLLLATSPFRWLYFVFSKRKRTALGAVTDMVEIELGTEISEPAIETVVQEEEVEEEEISLAASEDDVDFEPEPLKPTPKPKAKRKKDKKKSRPAASAPRFDQDQDLRAGQMAPSRRTSEVMMPPPKAQPAPPPPAPITPEEPEEDTYGAKLEDETFEDEEEKEEKEEKKKKSSKAADKRAQMIKYILDILKKLCLYDPLDRVIVFAGATILILFTTNVNYGILFYSGAPYIEAPYLDMIARDTNRWFECTKESFTTNFSALGVVDFIGLGVTACGVFFQLPTLLNMLMDQ